MKTLDDYAALLTINKHALDDELLIQAEVSYRIGDRLAEAKAVAEELTEQAKRVEGTAFVTFKNASDADKLATEKARFQPEVRDWKEKVRLADLEQARWTNLSQSWEKRGYALRELCLLYGAGYFAVGPGSNYKRPEVARHDYSKDASTRTRRKVGE